MAVDYKTDRWTATLRSWVFPTADIHGLTESEVIAAGRRKIRRSQATALATGGVLLSSSLFAWDHWLAGLLIGLLYANAFEYFCHRFLLHATTGYFSQRHQMHHESWKRSEGALYVRFGPPLGVVLLLLVNSVPFALWDRLGAGIGAGVVIAFVAYYMVYEEMHWRIHMTTLPRCLLWMRRNHFAHHREIPGRYSVLLPLFDKLLR